MVGRANEADSSPPTIPSSKHGQLPEARRRQSTGQYHSAEQQSRVGRLHQRILAGGPRTADSLQRNYTYTDRSSGACPSLVKSREQRHPISCIVIVSSDFSPRIPLFVSPFCPSNFRVRCARSPFVSNVEKVCGRLETREILSSFSRSSSSGSLAIGVLINYFITADVTFFLCIAPLAMMTSCS